MAVPQESLKEITSFLYPVRVKWYEIGTELGVKAEILERIKSQCKDPADCLHQMLMEWLRSISPPPTWRSLDDALRSTTVNEVALAEKGKPAMSVLASNHVNEPLYNFSLQCLKGMGVIMLEVLGVIMLEVLVVRCMPQFRVIS